MVEQKTYQYKKPAKEGKKAPLILCRANNEAHAMQLFRERFKHDDGTYEWIDKSLIEEYVPQPKKEKKTSKKSSKKS